MSRRKDDPIRVSRGVVVSALAIGLVTVSSTAYYFGETSTNQLEQAAYERCLHAASILEDFNTGYGASLESFIRDAAKARLKQAQDSSDDPATRKSNRDTAARYKVLYENLKPFVVHDCKR